MDPQHNTTPQQTHPEPQPQQDEDMPSDDDLNLFHKSSLKDKQQVPLPQIVPEAYNIKRTVTQNGQYKIKDYIEVCKIGEGAFAQVKKVRNWGNAEQYAMKVYGLLKLKGRKFYAADGSFADSQEMFRNEVEILKRLQHQNLVKCHEIMYGGNYAYLIMQFCEFGQIMDWSSQLNNYVRNKKIVQYLCQKYKTNSIQNITRLIFLQTALGIQYLHSNSISNRDIKVDNILCKRTQQQGNDIKIADFTTIRYSADDISYFSCGTAGFRGPEIQYCSSDGYSCKALDVWGLGISMYTFYFQKFPFMAETEYEVEARAEKEELQFGEACPSWFSNVIQKMTKKNWKERINIDQVILLVTQSGNN